MSDGYAWVVIVGLTAVTILTRAGFLVLGDRVRLPERLQHALRYAPVCALVALVAPAILQPQESLAATLLHPELVAGVVAVATMLASRSVLGTLALGMLAYTALRLV